MKLLEIESIEFGYCHQCDQPSIVNVITLKGWKHKFCICSYCFRELDKKILEYYQYPKNSGDEK